jgi:hypothetical protein
MSRSDSMTLHPRRTVLACALCLLPPLLAGCSKHTGWVLVRPPVAEQKGRYVVSPRASLQFWDQAGAFDSASACEEERKAKQPLSAEPASAGSSNRSQASAHAEAWAAARCVPSNAVYPKAGARELGYGPAE